MVVVGPVGSGKSSLLSAILGEMNVHAGAPGVGGENEGRQLLMQRAGARTPFFIYLFIYLFIPPLPPTYVDACNNHPLSLILRLREGIRTAFCAQRPWILATTVKRNVVMAGRSEDYTTGKDEVDGEGEGGEKIDLELYERALHSCRLIRSA